MKGSSRGSQAQSRKRCFRAPGEEKGEATVRARHTGLHRLAVELDRGFPDGSAGKESACNAGDLGFGPWVGKIPWRRERQPTPVV